MLRGDDHGAKEKVKDSLRNWVWKMTCGSVALERGRITSVILISNRIGLSLSV